MFKKVCLLFAMFFSSFLHAKTVYIVPFGGHDIFRLFYNPQGGRDEVTKAFCAMREGLENNGYSVEFTWNGEGIDHADFAGLISLTEDNPTLLANISNCPKEKCFLYVFEPPVVQPQMYHPNLTHSFGKIFVLPDIFVDDVSYFKFYYPQPRQEMIENRIPFSEKKLSALISANKDSGHPNSLYYERRLVIQYYAEQHPGELDLYGPGWEGHIDWKGTVPHKWEAMKNYKFCYCYENMGNQEGYITEKIFDCLVSGSVPIYLGATNIGDFIPKECFIDRRNFSSNEELYQFLTTMNEEDYNSYIESIENYFKTPAAQIFSIDTFVNTLLDAISSVNQ